MMLIMMIIKIMMTYEHSAYYIPEQSKVQLCKFH